MHALNPVRRVGDQIGEALIVHRTVPEREVPDQVGALLERVGIPARRARDW